MKANRKILVRTPNWIGDHVMAYPFYRALKLAYPGDEIHFLAPETLASFSDQEFCSKKLIQNKSAKRFGPSFLQMVSELKKENYDFVLSLTASLSSSILFWLARIPVRVGFGQSGSQIFWTSSLKWKGRNSGLHKSQIYLELLNYMTAQEWSLERSNPPREQRKTKTILVAPGASIELRVWPYFKELIHALSQQFPQHQIKIVGGKAESHWHQKIKDWGLANLSDVIEESSLSQLIEWCGESALVIANDSGAAHLAGTLAQVPTLVLFGPGDPQYIRPLGPQIYCLTPEGVDCHPCEKPYCHAKLGYQACLKAISWEKVLTQVRVLIPS